uniref:Phosphoinositide-3-kinase, regulatory subunit 6b n=1 Tax=Pundamilia nyererei TaxID=303518 RepID=A0A3B4GY40_9CICH
MLVWNLQRKVEVNPSCSLSIISILVQKLEKTLTTVSKVCPSSSLVKIKLCSCAKAVHLKTFFSLLLQTLSSTGSLYLKRVIAEQNIKSEHFAAREKVFVLADPAVFSVSLEATAPATLKGRSGMDGCSCVILFPYSHQAIHQDLMCSPNFFFQVLEDHDVRQYFQDVVETVKQSLQHGPGSRADYLKGLKQIHKNILAASEKGLSVVCYNTRNLLTDFALPSGSNPIKDDKERISRDSGIVKDLKDSDEAEQLPYTAQKTLRERRNALKNSKSAEKLSLMEEKMKEDVTGNSPLLKEERSHTARIVVLGDDSTLGKLTKAYYIIRKKEAKRNMLTKKLDLQLYYIPVSDAESRLSLASCLERVDPWYSVNVSSLGAAIPTLPELPSVSRKPTELSLYLLDTLCYYLRCGTQPVNLPVYSVKVQQSYRKIETRNISIRTMEQRTLCVCLDKDPRRIYTNVQKIEISPCLDPGCTIRCRYSIGSEQELPLSKYLDKVMSLPINSFSGVSM